jgi:hypothetical protein
MGKNPRLACELRAPWEPGDHRRRRTGIELASAYVPDHARQGVSQPWVSDPESEGPRTLHPPAHLSLPLGSLAARTEEGLVDTSDCD